MFPLIGPAQLIAEPGDLIVVDVRHDLSDPTAGFRAYASGHLPNAAFLSVDDDLSGEPSAFGGGRHPLPKPEEFTARLAELGANEQTLLVAYDASGGLFAARFWWLARWIGHMNVAVLNGGIQAWVQQGGQLKTDGFERKRKGRISQRPSLSPRWNLEAVEEWVAEGSNLEFAVLVDARSADRFHGQNETLDPVAGHIPGALNRPFKDNLLESGEFKPREVLADEFESLLAGRDPMAVVHSCGSGISACHNILAMEAAGLLGSALYPGSWSEWCTAGPGRPVAL